MNEGLIFLQEISECTLIENEYFVSVFRQIFFITKPFFFSVFSLFSIVTFQNQGCTSLDSTRNGTCYTSTECQDKNGMVSGNCASGFGVCCLFLVSEVSTVINENCTYIRNPGFPSVYSATNALTYTIQKCSSDVCSVRYFQIFFILAPFLVYFCLK